MRSDKKQWFFLVSSMPLFEECEVDHYIVKQEELPNWLRLNTLYVYNYSKNGDNSNYVKEYKLSELKSCYIEKENNQKVENIFNVIPYYPHNFQSLILVKKSLPFRRISPTICSNESKSSKNQVHMQNKTKKANSSRS